LVTHYGWRIHPRRRPPGSLSMSRHVATMLHGADLVPFGFVGFLSFLLLVL
jgi:hypothetical protein